MNELKIAALDIETAPAKVYTYSLFKPMITHKQIIEPSRIICFSYQFEGQKSVKYVSEFEEGGQKALLQALWNVLDEADVVLGYNSQGFDVPWILGELMASGLPKPSPVKHIDLYKTMRQNTRFLSRKLDYVSERLLADKKVDVNMMTLAIACESDDPAEAKKARNLLRRYSKQDVALLFPLFEKVRSYVKMPHPASSEEGACHSCKSLNVHRRGTVKTLVSTYQRYRCNDCGSWFRGTYRLPATTLRAI